MSYAETEYLDIDQNNRSLLVAFSNLLQRFDNDTDPLQLAIILNQDGATVDWWSIANHLDIVTVVEVSDEMSWPPTNNAIVKFRRMDQAAAGPVDHYCLVADPNAHSIIDSLDGKIKAASVYGVPLGWCSYEHVLDVIEAAQLAASTSKPGSLYKVLKGGESGWSIAMKLKIPPLDLKEHNDLEDFDMIPEGVMLHLPTPILENDQPKAVVYRILPEPVDMHVSKEDGARKWSFGNARTFNDISASGPIYPVNTNVVIVAVAEVPILEEGVEITAAYYLDKLALGTYGQPGGRVQYTVGFNHSHLAEGHMERVVLAPKPQVQEILEEIEVAIAPEETIIETKDVAEDWRDTYHPFHEDLEPDIYYADASLRIHDYEEVRDDKSLVRGKAIRIAGTFWKDGVEIGRLQAAVEVDLWFGIPMSLISMEEDDELYNYDVPLAERVTLSGGGHLTFIEKYWYVPFAKLVSQYARFKYSFTKNKQNKE